MEITMSKEQFGEIINTTKKVTKKVANTTMELADIAALNVKLQSQRVKLSERFEKLGRLSYEKLENSADNAEAIAQIVEEIGKMKEAIENTNAEIKAKKTARAKKKAAEKMGCNCDECPLK